MPLNQKLQQELAKTYAPRQRYDKKFAGKDITYITNDLGEPVTLFIGNRNSDGSINGERFVRKIIRHADGQAILKSHWENKGKVTKA